MSRVGVKPISVPGSVDVRVDGREVTVESSSKRLSTSLRPEVYVELDKDQGLLRVRRRGDSREEKAMHGTTRAVLANMIQGVSEGFSQVLEIVGVGWTAQVQGQQLSLNLGFADTKYVAIPEELSVSVEQSQITVSGADKQAVGQLAAKIRGTRPPEPYNGKGIRYKGEKIVGKEGKAFAGR